MFGHRYFGERYFGPRYWGAGGSEAPEVAAGTWEQDFYAALMSSAALVALVGDQVFPVVAHEGASAPYVVYGRDLTARRYSLEGFDTELEKVTGWVRCYAEGVDEAAALARAVIAAVPQSGWPIHRTAHSNQDLGLEPGTRLFTRLVEFSTFHRG